MITDFLSKAVTAWHGVKGMEDLLKEAGFIPLKEKDSWDLKAGQSYYLSKNGRSLAAFRVGSAPIPQFNIIAAHTDSPHLRLKVESLKREDQFLTGTVTPYGGPILPTWFDRPLGIAGSVLIDRDGEEPERRLYRSSSPVGIIPNAAIHLNRKVNKGYEIFPQKHMIVQLNMEQDLEDWLAEELNIDRSRILTIRAELFIHQAPELIGKGETALLNAPRIDNLIHCILGIKALDATPAGNGTPLLLLFDSEETGSRTSEGAQSALTEHLMERICLSLGIDRESQLRGLSQSSLLSADVAHGWNPGFSEKYDLDYKCLLNEGPVIKSDPQNHYITTEQTEGAFRKAARELNVPLQLFINHSDLPLGSTVGPILSAGTTIPTLDVGVPVWAMHSGCETAGMRDIGYMEKLFKAFLGAYSA
ncbi:MAG: M18 family aminopeptidase [Spirochaetales bacterium]|nr:M18 family aminopeptidase [Spirochaetales bacterium]